VRPFAASLVAFGMAAAFPAAVNAQIYSWRDPSGQLVLSDRPLGKVVTTYAVREGSAIRSTRGVVGARARQYESLIRQHAAEQGVHPDLVRAVIQTESAFDPSAVSAKGALGLMQLMPSTAEALGVRDPFDPAENIRGGVAYLRQLLDRYDNDETLALAAYNAGPGAVDRFGRVPPYRETRDYVAKVRREVGRTTVSSAGGKPVYRTVEIIDGREVTRYSNVPPSSR
jgi:soluble lytic murein transglycosylase-like protein